jgi:hypothetical protein
MAAVRWVTVCPRSGTAPNMTADPPTLSGRHTRAHNKPDRTGTAATLGRRTLGVFELRRAELGIMLHRR